MLSDEALVQRSLQHGSHHFGELVKRHSDYLYGFGIRVTGGDAELAKDLSQQAFVKAYRHLSNFNARHTSDNAQARHRFRNWLTGIAVNCFRDLVKTENRFQALNAGLEPKYHPVDNDSQGFFDLIKPLSNQERLIFTLRYIYEYNIEEIAQMTEIKPGTLKSKISRALQRLRDNSHE